MGHMQKLHIQMLLLVYAHERDDSNKGVHRRDPLLLSRGPTEEAQRSQLRFESGPVLFGYMASHPNLFLEKDLSIFPHLPMICSNGDVSLQFLHVLQTILGHLRD